MLFRLYVNSLPDAVRSSQIAVFADDAKIFKEITSTRDAEQLQEDLFDLLTWSDSASLNFNFSKCKAQRITRKLKPVIFVYHMDGSQLEVLSAEKDLVVYITDNLTWNKQVNEQCAMASMLLGYTRRDTRLVKSITVRRSAYLILVRTNLGYVTILDSAVNKSDSKARACPEARYKVYPGSTYHSFATRRKGTGGLSPISYWHGFVDMNFFFKAETGTVRVSPSVLPRVLVTRTTRSAATVIFLT